jgi:hypothetical protein
MLSIDKRDPGLDNDSRSSFDLLSVSYIALVDGVLFTRSLNSCVAEGGWKSIVESDDGDL